MNKYKIGFIGAGKMAGAIIKGLLKTGFVSSNEIIATQSGTDKIAEKSKDLGIKVTVNNIELAQNSDTIIIAVKPNQVSGVLEEIKSYINKDKLIVSIAAGVSTNSIENCLPSNTRVIRVMPNTPALVGEGMSGIVGGKHATKDDLQYIQNMLSAIGRCIILEKEEHIDIVTAISGSGPAFFYKIMEEIARAGEQLGLDYEKSLLLSIQTAIGSAKMALNRTIPMEELISNVATKGGCTRVGVDCMDNKDSKKLFYEVIRSTAQKAHELGK